MAKIHTLSIENYRGIKKFEHKFGSQNCVVLIGRGDSGKTTILKAIASVLSPQWNTVFSDFDFTNRDISKSIIIEVVLTEIPDELMSLSKYGEYYQILKNEIVIPNIEEEDTEACERVLKVRLTVDETLEPKWNVISDREISEKPFSPIDRAKLNMFMVSDYIDNHFTFSKGSPTYATFKQNIEKDQLKVPERKLVDLVRQAYSKIREVDNFNEFEDTVKIITDNAKQLGLSISELQPLLEFRQNTYAESSITLHSEDIPFRLQGKGSKRLLSIAIQYGLVKKGGIILIDEIEQGLESDRVRNLVRKFTDLENGQVFITTHSKDVVLEPSADQIFLMKKGAESLINFSSELQGTLRSKPEAFFAKRIISCEGATEEGIIRAFSNHVQQTNGNGLTNLGIVHIDGSGGNKFYKYAKLFKDIGFEVMVFCDDDNRNVDIDRDDAIGSEITVVKCDYGLAIEQQIFKDLPWEAVCELVEYADNAEIEKNDISIFPIALNYSNMDDIRNVPLEEQNILRTELGSRAKSKKGSWFKNITHGEFLGNVWVKYKDELQEEDTLKKEYNQILTWIYDGTE